MIEDELRKEHSSQLGNELTFGETDKERQNELLFPVSRIRK